MTADVMPRSFWRDVWAIRGAITTVVMPRVLVFGLIASLVMLARHRLGGFSLQIGPVELVGATLALLLVIRTNAGYDRWYEGRKLWGGIVNQSRNLAIAALSYASGAPAEWRDRLARLVVVFAHVSRRTLRAERELPEVVRLLGPEPAAGIARADHMPSAVAAEIAQMLQEAADRGWLAPFAMHRCDDERGRLIDHIGGCERILKSPLPLVYVIKVRRFVALYLIALPFSLIEQVGWITPLLTMLVAYPMLGLDQISVELENPFSPRNLGHLPLDSICSTVESNVMSLGQPGGRAREPSEPSEQPITTPPPEPFPTPRPASS